MFPEATPYYNVDHIITKIGSRYYDIEGETSNKNYQPLKTWMLNKVFKQTYKNYYTNNNDTTRI